jgi:glycosyltransferase involved in cell wall biosynthesis
VREWRRVAEKWGVGTAERSMCVVVPSFNNGRQFRVELNLNSIFSQNYTNYHVVIVDDASTDSTVALIRKYLSFHRIPPTKALLLVNSRPKKALENIYTAAMEKCGLEEVVVVVDGDD